MKRRLSVILILLTFSLIAISCGNMVKTSSGEKDSEIEKSNDIVMSIKEQREKDLTLSIENKTNNEYVYGYEFYLEQEKDGKWNSVPFLKNVAFIEIGIILKPKGINNENIKLETYFRKLDKGKYRIVKEFYKDEEKKKAFVEFSL